MFKDTKNNSVYSYLIDKINSDGALHFSLIDPDPLQQSPRKAAKMANCCANAGSDAILVGGSTIINQGFVSKTINRIKKEVEIPVIIFPGGMSNFSVKADAILFMSLLNSKDPYFIVGQQALASYPIKTSGVEYISMAYLIIEPGATAGWVGNAKLLPRKKPKLTAAYALTAEMYGFRMIYLEAGSGGDSIPPSHISLTSRVVSIPVVAGGGVKSSEDARAFVEAGADIVVMGTYIEENVLKDEGECLVPIIDEIKAAGEEQNKNYKKISNNL